MYRVILRFALLFCIKPEANVIESISNKGEIILIGDRSSNHTNGNLGRYSQNNLNLKSDLNLKFCHTKFLVIKPAFWSYWDNSYLLGTNHQFQ